MNNWIAPSIRTVAVATALTLCLIFGYKNGWDSNPDFRTVIITLLALLGAELPIKAMSKVSVIAFALFAPNLYGQKVIIEGVQFSQEIEITDSTTEIRIPLQVKKALPTTPVGSLNVLDFGATPNDNTDDTAAFNSALSKAKIDKKSVFVPAGRYTHNQMINVDSVSMFGVGETTVIVATNSQASSIFLKGTSPSLSLMTVYFNTTGTTRQSGGNKCGILCENVTSFIIKDLTVDGSPSAGIMNWGGKGTSTVPCLIKNCKVRGTLADGIHNAFGASNVRVEDCTISSHDDGIAVISYLSNPVMCENIKILRNTIQSVSWGRGIGISGGRNLVISDNIVSNTVAAGMIIVSEGTPWNTHGVSNVVAERNTFNRSCIDSCPTGHSAILVLGRSGYMVSNVQLNNNKINDPGTDGIRIWPFVSQIKLTGNVFSGISSSRKAISIHPDVVSQVTVTP